MPSIAVLIPCYNESQTIAKVVDDYRSALPEADIYVYDNNSTDHTDEIARKAGAIVRYERRQGKGNRIVRFLINKLFKSDIRDIMTGYRAFSRRFVKTFPVLSKGFEIETEMTIHALDKNLLLQEVPVSYRDRPEGSVSKLNTFRDGIRVLRTISSLYRYYRPLSFFSSIAVLFLIAALILSCLYLLNFFQQAWFCAFPR